MITLHLVRHGQASFGAEDYDQLSEIGQRQCAELGRHFATRGLRFDAVLCGTLRRHAQSLEALAQAFGQPLPPAQATAALDEYDSHALIRCLHPQPLPELPAPEAFRHHFRLLRQALLAWMEERISPAGMPAHRDWVAGVTRTLHDLASAGPGVTGLGDEAHVLVVSSGGPISTAVGWVLELSPPRVIDLNMRIRNSAVTEIQLAGERRWLTGFNSAAHLEHPDRLRWLTYA